VRSLVLCFVMLLMGGLAQGQNLTYTPDDVYKVGIKDLTTRVPPEKRPYVRYLDFHVFSDVPAQGERYSDRDVAINAMVFELNSTTFKTDFVRPVMIANRTLMRIDLQDLKWDKVYRAERIAKLAKIGVKFADAEKPEFIDIWESFARADVFFAIDYTDKYGKFLRGWLDPVVEAEARNLTHSSKFILRADWLIPRLLVERKFRGFYSDIMLFPNKEADLYKAMGADFDFFGDNLLKSGGAILGNSIVAQNNRELQLVPGAFGYDERFIWLTFDFNETGKENKSVIHSLAGTAKHDGREIIGSLPNGLHWYYLSAGDGNQVADVPPDIAQDKRQGPLAIRDRRVINAYKCISCHGEANGTYPFKDVIFQSMQNEKMAAFVVSKDKDKAALTKEALEEYYNSRLGKAIARQQKSYVERVKACNGLESPENSEQLVLLIESYTFDAVSPERAAAEMGVPLSTAKVYWKRAGNPIATFLYGGESVPRGDWEAAFADVMRAIPNPWERRDEFIKIKVKY
jgi:hypothetical protein